MSNADLIERLHKAIYSATAEDARKAADALAAADKRIAEQAEEITMLRHKHLLTCGTTHPEMYKTELDYAKERIASLKDAASFNFEQYQDAAFLLCEANEKLDVAREALKVGFNSFDTGLNRDNAKWQIYEAIAQIGGEDAS